MISLDSRPLFSSGPCELIPGPTQRQIIRRGLPGLDGEVIQDLGKRSRPMRQTGRLQATTSNGLQALINDIEATCDGETHTHTDHTGEVRRVLVEAFARTTPIRRGRTFWCEYELLLRELP